MYDAKIGDRYTWKYYRPVIDEDTKAPTGENVFYGAASWTYYGDYWEYLDHQTGYTERFDWPYNYGKPAVGVAIKDARGENYPGIWKLEIHINDIKKHEDAFTLKAIRVKRVKDPKAKTKDPINFTNGEISYTYQDLFIPARGIPLKFVRNYLSQSDYNGPLGYGWTHNYNIHKVSEEGEFLTIMDEDGSLLEFTTYKGKEYHAPVGNYYKLTKNGTYVLRRKDGTVYNLDTSGKLTSIVDRNGNQVTLSYTGNLLTTITDASGDRNIRITYNEDNQIESISDGVNPPIIFRYNDGNLVSVTNQLSDMTTYEYDTTTHNLMTITDANTHHTYFTYDAQDRAISTWNDEDNNKVNLDYSGTYTTILTNSKGSQTTYHFNIFGGVYKIIDPLSNTQKFGWDMKLNKTSTEDENGHITYYGYDNMGNLGTITDAADNITRFTYHSIFNLVTSIDDPTPNPPTIFTYNDANGDLLSVQDPLGNITLYEYNGYGQVRFMTNAKNKIEYRYENQWDDLTSTIQAPDTLKITTSFTYDEVGNRISMTDANGNTTQYIYDKCNRLTDIIYPGDNGKTHYEYDGVGNRISMTDANGVLTTYEYDVVNRLETVTIDPSGLAITTTYQYDTEGNKIGMTDPEGNVTTYEYNSLNRLIKVISEDPDGVGPETPCITTFEYDPVGNRTKLIDGEGNMTRYEYDVLNRLGTVTQVLDAKDLKTVYRSDEVGNLRFITDANAHTSEYQYDALNRLRYSMDPLLNTTEYRYDEVGNLRFKKDANQNTIEYIYDKVNRLESIKYPDTKQVNYEYDPVGNLTKMKDFYFNTWYEYDELNRLGTETQFAKAIKPKKVRYRYDNAGNRISLTDPYGKILRYEYDAANRLTDLRLQGDKDTISYTYNPVGTKKEVNYPNGVKTSFDYDNLNRLTNLLNKNHAGTISSFNYAYDRVGNKIYMLTNSGRTSYTYDDLYRLTHVEYPEQTFTDYTYDDVGNRDTMTTPEGVINYTYDVADRLLQAGATTYTYDANDNMVSKIEVGATTNYTYDYDNRLITIQNPQSKIQNSYDGYGRRFDRKIGKERTRYLWDGQNELLEYDFKTGKLLAKYIYANGQLVSKELGVAIFGRRPKEVSISLLDVVFLDPSGYGKTNNLQNRHLGTVKK